MAHEVTLITGDGTGPELAEAARLCVDATGVKINWDVQEAGVDVMARTGHAAAGWRAGQRPPDEVRPESPDHHAGRHRLPLDQRAFAAGAGPVCLHSAVQILSRRAELFQRSRRRYRHRPREHRRPLCRRRVRSGKPATAELIEFINKISTDKKIKTKAAETGVSIKPISVSGTERIVRCAFEYARKHKRKKVTAVHKANIMKYSDGLYLQTAQQRGQGISRHRIRRAHRR